MSERPKPDRLVVLSWAGGWGQALRQAVSEPFERETGIHVEHLQQVGLRLPAALQQALERGARPPVDVVWSNSVPALRAQRAGHCQPFDLRLGAVLRELRARARPDGTAPEGLAVVHPFVVYYVLAYHEQAFPAGAPRSWNVLLEARHRGKIALYPGGNGFYPIAQVMGGGQLEGIPDAMEPCWAYFRKLRGQIGQLDYSVGMEERLRSRELDLCFRALPNALAFRSAGVPVGWCVPTEGTTDTLDAFWVPRGLPESASEGAQSYIAFALRPDVQERWCAQLGVMPVHPRAAIPELFREREDLPRHADDRRGILAIPEALKVEREALWEQSFEAILAARD
jgi:putative spermidine/putrescine transport system substrate-binding protein